MNLGTMTTAGLVGTLHSVHLLCVITSMLDSQIRLQQPIVSDHTGSFCSIITEKFKQVNLFFTFFQRNWFLSAPAARKSVRACGRSLSAREARAARSNILQFECGGKRKPGTSNRMCPAFVYLPATLRPSTSTLGAPKAVLPMTRGRWQLLAMATMFFSSS